MQKKKTLKRDAKKEMTCDEEMWLMLNTDNRWMFKDTSAIYLVLERNLIHHSV